MPARILVAVAALAAFAVAPAQGQPAHPATALVARLEQAVISGNADAVVQLGGDASVPGLRAFASAASPPPTRFVIKERDRAALTAATERLLLEVFSQYGNEAVITTWRMDLAVDEPAPGERRIVELEQLSTISGLHRLALNPSRHFEIRNLTLEATDLTLEIPSGHAFVAETSEGPTAVVLLGRGRMRFAPADPAERTQVRIFNGEESLSGEFDAAFVRIRPAEFRQLFPASSLLPRAVGQSEFRRAADVFDQYVTQTLHLDLTDLSRERWSLTPSPGDLIVEIRTRRFGSLTYARSSKEAEDISLFERRRRRNIAVYASKQKLSSRGRFYSEEDLVDYDVLRYDVEASFAPERMWIDGTALLRIKVRSFVLSTLTLRLAEPLVVRSIISPEYGRLLYLRVVGQNSVIVNFPGMLARDAELHLQVVYSGRLEPQQIEREGIAVGQQAPQQQEFEHVFIPIEPQYIYSNRSYWYPQSTVTDYAPARLRVSVPGDYDVIASGTSAEQPTPITEGLSPGQRPPRLFVFESVQPIRYLACVISRFSRVHSRQLLIPTRDRSVTVPGAGAEGTEGTGHDRHGGTAARGTGPDAAEGLRGGPRAGAGQLTLADYASMTLNVDANPRQTGRARSLTDRAASILQYYGSIIGDAPFPSFTLAVTENELPGGHSPAYFAVLNHPPPTAPLSWRNDPVVFDNYQHFFLAHELAHQWWGQAVGWKNYHEQWLSEGFSQYFAALYAASDRGDALFTTLLRQMRRWSVEQSSQGPIYLGYRLGHIRGEGRIFRALVYNKGAMVLHMLRRLLGDTVFFNGLRQFYKDWKFKKAGSDDLRVAMERVSKQDLAPFFEAWVYGSDVPALRFTSTITGSEALVRFEHRGAVMPVPVTVTIVYSDEATEEFVVPVTESIVERTVPLRGPVRSIEANRDHGAVAEITR